MSAKPTPTPLSLQQEFEAWAVRVSYAERDANGTVWFHRNGGDGMPDAFKAGAEHGRATYAIEKRDEYNAISAAAGRAIAVLPDLLACAEMLALVTAEGKFQSEAERIKLHKQARAAIAKTETA